MRTRGNHMFDDAERQRFVVYRGGCGVRRKTSVRYGEKRSRREAITVALAIVAGIEACQPSELSRFQFSK